MATTLQKVGPLHHRARAVHPSGRAFACTREIQGLQSAIESHEDLMRRYCSRRDSAGVQCSLSEDIRMASLEALLPEGLERHIHMSRSRILSYQALREEVVAYAESRGSDAHHPPARRGQDRGSNMDVDAGAFDRKGKDGKGKHKNGKGKGAFDKKDIECWSCGKRGHTANECRLKDTECWNCGNVATRPASAAKTEAAALSACRLRTRQVLRQGQQQGTLRQEGQ